MSQASKQQIGQGLQNLILGAGQGLSQGVTRGFEESRTQSLLKKYAAANSTSERLSVLAEIDPKEAAKAIREQEKQKITQEANQAFLGRIKLGPQGMRNGSYDSTNNPDAEITSGLNPPPSDAQIDAELANFSLQNPQGGKAITDIIKMNRKQQAESKAEARKNHEETQKYDEEVAKEEGEAIKHQITSGQAREILESGRYDPNSLENLTATYYKGSKWANYFVSPDRALLEAAALNDFVGIRSIFGGVMSDKDVAIASGKVIDPTKSNEANLRILDFRDFIDSLPLKEAEIGRQIKAENNNMRPAGYRDMVREKMRQQYAITLNRLAARATNEEQVFPSPTPQDPLMITAYGELPEGHTRMWKGTDFVEDVPFAYVPEYLDAGYEPLEQGAQ